jgi:DNA-binding MarR family transcriptional regulator
VVSNHIVYRLAMPPSRKRIAWVRLLEAHTVLVDLFEAELRRDCGVPLAWYDVLIKVWLAPGHRLRMADLADQVLLSRSWLTRRVDQLEEAGLVRREHVGEDGRGVLAVMTEQGLETFAAMERSHTRSIEEHFSSLLTRDEAAVLVAACGRIAIAGRASLARDRVSA